MTAATVENPGAVGAEKFWTSPSYGTPERFGALSIYSYDVAGVPYFLILRGNARKPVAHYRARSIESRAKAIADAKGAEVRKIEFKAMRKAKRSSAKDAVNIFVVGDVLVRSWGYDQTNVDFIEVVEVLPRSVRVRAIRQRFVGEAHAGAMSAYVAPLPGEWADGSEPYLLKLRIDTWGDAPRVIGAGQFSLTDRPSYFCSWYA